jgi:Txe/YoeB family toxin of Txe-Axe toxin-antitoxin module
LGAEGHGRATARLAAVAWRGAAYHPGGTRHVETLEEALALEFRFTYRSHSDADFIEGTRALIIDKDRSPNWSVPIIEALTQDRSMRWSRRLARTN